MKLLVEIALLAYSSLHVNQSARVRRVTARVRSGLMNQSLQCGPCTPPCSPQSLRTHSRRKVRSSELCDRPYPLRLQASPLQHPETAARASTGLRPRGLCTGRPRDATSWIPTDLSQGERCSRRALCVPRTTPLMGTRPSPHTPLEPGVHLPRPTSRSLSPLLAAA